jgi:hypothetical protein
VGGRDLLKAGVQPVHQRNTHACVTAGWLCHAPVLSAPIKTGTAFCIACVLLLQVHPVQLSAAPSPPMHR